MPAVNGPDCNAASVRYRTIVADPPWPYAGTTGVNRGRLAGTRAAFLPYDTMTLDEIKSLAVPSAPDAHLFLWTTNRYLEDAFDVARAWGFRPSSTLTWCKDPVGVGPGGLFAITSEFVLYARKGAPNHKRRVETTWWRWPRGGHSQKPAAFLDLIEAVLDGPYLEMFARRDRLGWDTWGNESLGTAELCA
jgi:N6-adenosine-specific RNA methylase IME4